MSAALRGHDVSHVRCGQLLFQYGPCFSNEDPVLMTRIAAPSLSFCSLSGILEIAQEHRGIADRDAGAPSYDINTEE